MTTLLIVDFQMRSNHNKLIMNVLFPLTLPSPESVSESIVLLADEWLLQLPLEAIRVFAVSQITSISRDFSLQFHYHRVHPAERSGNFFFLCRS